MKMTSLVTLAAAIAVGITPVAVLAQPTDRGENEVTVRPAVTQPREHTEARAQERMASVEERRAELQQKVKERRAEIKEKVCERRQQNLTRVMPRLAQGATSVLNSMDTVYGRVSTFYEKGQLTVANYDELAASVELAKTNAAASVASIESQSFELDCENPRVGQQLDGYRLAVQDARESLMGYKKTLVALISAMRAAAAVEQDSGTEASQSSRTNDTSSPEGGSDNE